MIISKNKKVFMIVPSNHEVSKMSRNCTRIERLTFLLRNISTIFPLSITPTIAPIIIIDPKTEYCIQNVRIKLKYDVNIQQVTSHLSKKKVSVKLCFINKIFS